MTGNEVAIFVGGALLAYWGVSVLLDKKRPDKGAKPLPLQDEAPVSQAAAPAADAVQGARWYEVLEISAQASREEILAAYRTLMMKNHPDRLATMSPEVIELAERRSRAINTACDEGLKVRGP